MKKTYVNFAQFNSLSKRSKCPNCKKRGLTLIEQPRTRKSKLEFRCAICKHTEPANFWRARFKLLPPILTFKEASKVIGADSQGSTLRRAKMEGRIETAGRALRKDGSQSGRDNLVKREELIRFYLVDFGHRDMKRKNIKEKHNGTQ